MIGIPIRLTFGRGVAENMIKLKRRDTGAVEMVSRTEIVEKVKVLCAEMGG